MTRAKLIAMAALFAAGIAPAPAGAQQQYGGTGGNPFEAVCGVKEAMVGIGGRYGAMLDAVEVLCAKIGLDGRYIVPPSKTARYGGGGGGEFSLVCPTDNVVTGIVGRAGTLVDALGIKCSKINVNYTVGAWSPASTGSTTLGLVGGSGGNPFASDCGGNPPAVGVTGRAGTLIDRIGARCLNYANIGFVEYQRYNVNVSVTPSATIFEGTPVTIAWSVTGGPPSSLTSTPRFKVETLEPLPPGTAGTTNPSPPSWPSASDIMSAAIAAYDYSGFGTDSSKAFQPTKLGIWAVRVTAVPFSPSGAGMRMFGGTKTVLVEVKVKPAAAAQPAATKAVQSGSMMEKKAK